MSWFIYLEFSQFKEEFNALLLCMFITENKSVAGKIIQIADLTWLCDNLNREIETRKL